MLKHKQEKANKLRQNVLRSSHRRFASQLDKLFQKHKPWHDSISGTGLTVWTRWVTLYFLVRIVPLIPWYTYTYILILILIPTYTLVSVELHKTKTSRTRDALGRDRAARLGWIERRQSLSCFHSQTCLSLKKPNIQWGTMSLVH